MTDVEERDAPVRQGVAVRSSRRVIDSAAPLVLLVVLSVIVWDPTLGIIVRGALVGSISALLAVGIALVYRANRIVNFAQGDLGVVPALLAILLLGADRPGARGDARRGRDRQVRRRWGWRRWRCTQRGSGRSSGGRR